MSGRLLEKVSSLCLILASLVVTGSLLYDHSTRQETASVHSPADGRTLSLTGVQWTRYKGTIVLALSTGCHFCTASAPFFRDLASFQKSRPDLSLVAVFPQSTSEAERYLNASGVKIDTVISQSLDLIEGTPTMFYVGQDGRIRRTWLGLLNNSQKHAALTEIESLLKG
jgi:hypothetical protein